MLDPEDFPRIRDYVIQILPEILRQEPEVAATIEGILAQHFPRRDEFARLLDELKQHREETDRNFRQVDQRFEQVDQRFNQVDQRFDQVEQTQLGMKQDITELQHGQGMLLEQGNRLEQTQLGMKRDIAKLQHGQEMLIEQGDKQEKWLRLVIGQLGNEKGQNLEDMFAAALQYGLKNPDITPEKIRLRQSLVDTEGRVFKRGFATEVDLIAENATLTVFEVKAGAKVSDVGIFALKVELVALQNPQKVVKGVFISLAATAEVRQQCAEYGLELVD